MNSSQFTKEVTSYTKPKNLDEFKIWLDHKGTYAEKDAFGNEVIYQDAIFLYCEYRKKVNSMWACLHSEGESTIKNRIKYFFQDLVYPMMDIRDREMKEKNRSKNKYEFEKFVVSFARENPKEKPKILNDKRLDDRYIEVKSNGELYRYYESKLKWISESNGYWKKEEESQFWTYGYSNSNGYASQTLNDIWSHSIYANALEPISIVPDSVRGRGATLSPAALEQAQALDAEGRSLVDRSFTQEDLERVRQSFTNASNSLPSSRISVEQEFLNDCINRIQLEITVHQMVYVPTGHIFNINGNVFSYIGNGTVELMQSAQNIFNDLVGIRMPLSLSTLSAIDNTRSPITSQSSSPQWVVTSTGSSNIPITLTRDDDEDEDDNSF